MKLACLVGSISRNAGGLQSSVRGLMHGIRLLGDEATVISVRDSFSDADLGGWAPLTVHLGAPFGPRRFGMSWEMARRLDQVQPELLHTHGLWTYNSLVAQRWHRRTRRPHIIHPHGMLDPWAVKNSAWKKRLAGLAFERAHLESAACLRALCQSEIESMRAYGLRCPVAVIPNGIELPDLDDLPQTAEPRGVLSTAVPGRKVLLFLSRIHPKKGLVHLLQAWKRTLDSQPSANEWVLAIAGWDEGGHEAQLKQLATDLSLAWNDVRSPSSAPPPHPSLLFLGPQFGPDKARAYRNCDAFILPSFSEGLPMVVLEAWAHGKPVIMTPMCNLPEGFAADAALRAEPEVESLAGALAALVALSDDARKAMGARGRQLVEERFTWPRVAAEMKGVNDWVVRGGSKPECVVET